MTHSHATPRPLPLRIRRFVLVLGTVAGVALLLGLVTGSAAAAPPQFGIENASTHLCASSGSGAPGTVVRQLSCSLYSNHSGSYQEYWALSDTYPGVKLEAFHDYNGQAMCATIRNGVLAVGTPLVMEPCASIIALGQQFDELGGVAGSSLHAYAESGRRVDNPNRLSPFCVTSRGGAGTAIVLARCNIRVPAMNWTGLGTEGTPGLPGPSDPTRG